MPGGPNEAADSFNFSQAISMESPYGFKFTANVKASTHQDGAFVGGDGVNPVFQELGPCPCKGTRQVAALGSEDILVTERWRCDAVGTKLTRWGHLVGCTCPSCRNRRNRTKGKAAQAKTHRRLGGEGFTPSNEESARPYTVECMVMPEVKTGEQVPASFDKFIATDWFRRALSQSERAVPFGSGALPCVVIRGDYAIVDIRRRKRV